MYYFKNNLFNSIWFPHSVLFMSKFVVQLFQDTAYWKKNIWFAIKLPQKLPRMALCTLSIHFFRLFVSKKWKEQIPLDLFIIARKNEWTTERQYHPRISPITTAVLIYLTFHVSSTRPSYDFIPPNEEPVISYRVRAVRAEPSPSSLFCLRR